MRIILLSLLLFAGSGSCGAFTTPSNFVVPSHWTHFKRSAKRQVYATIPQKDEARVIPPKFEESSDALNKIQLGKAIPYSQLTIGVVKETYPGENRVSQSPDSVAALVKEGFNVIVQAGGTLIFKHHFVSGTF